MTYSIISIDYDEHNPASYRKTLLYLADSGTFTFTSGSPNIDYNTAITIAFRRGFLPLMDSSVESFMRDSGGALKTD